MKIFFSRMKSTDDFGSKSTDEQGDNKQSGKESAICCVTLGAKMPVNHMHNGPSNEEYSQHKETREHDGIST